MDGPRVDEPNTLPASRRASRRQALQAGGVGLAAAALARLGP